MDELQAQPCMMTVGLRHRLATVCSSVFAGGIVCWLSGSILGLACPIVALFVTLGSRSRTLIATALGLLSLISVGYAVAVEESSFGWPLASLFLLSLAVCCVAGSRNANSRSDANQQHVGNRGDWDVPASLDQVHPEDRASASHAAAYAFWTGVPQVIKYRQRQTDGEYRWVEMRAEPGYGVSVDVDPMISDLDERWLKRGPIGETGEAVRAAKVIESLYGKAWALNAAGEFTYVTPSGQIAIGMTLHDLNRRLEDDKGFVDGGDHGWSLGVHPDDYPRAAESFRQSLRTGEHWHIEYRMLRTTGNYVWHRIAARPTLDGTGKITGWYGTSIDIDVYKKTEAALRESERSLRDLIGSVPALIWCTSADGEPIYFSEQFRDFLGFDVDAKDAEGQSRLTGVLNVIVHDDYRAALTRKFMEALKTGESFSFKHRLRRFDGEFRWVDMRVAAMKKADGTILQWSGVCFDVEDQVRSQDELRIAQESYARASQAASLAELSASIAHEIGQPLAALVSSSDASKRWLTSDPPNLERGLIALDRVIRSAATAVETVKRVRALFRHAADARHSTAFDALLGEARELLADEAARRGVRISVEIEHDLPPVMIDPVQVQQVLTNLMRNGIEAMDGVGGERRLSIRARRVDDGVQVDVTDAGPGVEFPKRIFDPFFTTKGEKGMGMGLAICRSIVESHGGRLWVQQAKPVGATFSFTLPIT